MEARAVVEAARLLRSHLSDVVDEKEIRALDERLLRALTASEDPSAVARTVYAVLADDRRTLEWAEDVLDDPLLRPPALQPLRAPSDSAHFGQGGVPAATRYECPADGQYVWYRMGLEAVPACPQHEGLILVVKALHA